MSDAGKRGRRGPAPFPPFRWPDDDRERPDLDAWVAIGLVSSEPARDLRGRDPAKIWFDCSCGTTSNAALRDEVRSYELAFSMSDKTQGTEPQAGPWLGCREASAVRRPYRTMASTTASATAAESKYQA